MTQESVSNHARCPHCGGEEIVVTDPHRLTGSSHMATRASDEAQHTPGPWIAQRQLEIGGAPSTAEQAVKWVAERAKLGNPDEWWLVATENHSGDPNDWFCICEAGNGTTSEANARLIASAPALKAENERLRAELAKYTDPVWWHNPPTARSQKNAEDAFAIGDQLEAEVERLTQRVRRAEAAESQRDAALEALRDALGPLAAWAGTYAHNHGIAPELHPTHQALIDHIQALLSSTPSTLRQRERAVIEAALSWRAALRASDALLEEPSSAFTDAVAAERQTAAKFWDSVNALAVLRRPS